MIRVVKISKKDILFDRQEASAILNKASNKINPLNLSGGFETDDRIVLFLESKEIRQTDDGRVYTIAPFSEISEDGVIGEINFRYTAGFTICMCFKINEILWGIFSSVNQSKD